MRTQFTVSLKMSGATRTATTAPVHPEIITDLEQMLTAVFPSGMKAKPGEEVAVTMTMFRDEEGGVGIETHFSEGLGVDADSAKRLERLCRKGFRDLEIFEAAFGDFEPDLDDLVEQIMDNPALAAKMTDVEVVMANRCPDCGRFHGGTHSNMRLEVIAGDMPHGLKEMLMGSLPSGLKNILGMGKTKPNGKLTFCVTDEDLCGSPFAAMAIERLRNTLPELLKVSILEAFADKMEALQDKHDALEQMKERFEQQIAKAHEQIGTFEDDLVNDVEATKKLSEALAAAGMENLATLPESFEQLTAQLTVPDTEE